MARVSTHLQLLGDLPLSSLLRGNRTTDRSIGIMLSEHRIRTFPIQRETPERRLGYQYAATFGIAAEIQTLFVQTNKRCSAPPEKKARRGRCRAEHESWRRVHENTRMFPLTSLPSGTRCGAICGMPRQNMPLVTPHGPSSRVNCTRYCGEEPLAMSCITTLERNWEHKAWRCY
jgi:hypothetical protein